MNDLPQEDLQNDLIVMGETAVRAFLRGTRKLQMHIEPMARGLIEARNRYPADRDFGSWLKQSAYSDIGSDDRAALIKLGEHWTIDVEAMIRESGLSSPELLWDRVVGPAVSDNPKPIGPETIDETPDGDADDDDDESGFYGAPRIARSNEAWDTIDPRLVRALVSAMPALRSRRIWESAAGSGLLADQLREAGCEVEALSDIAPRRADVAEQDLLDADKLPGRTDAIVTNPPWGLLGAPFVRHALQLAAPIKGVVVMLLPLPWITGSKVADLTDSPGFDVLIVPRFRARWMTEAEEAELVSGPSSPKMNHIWAVWDFARDAGLAPIIEFVDAPEESDDVD